MPHEIIVSIQCLVYNHEPYLRQCLEGFVMQQTDFRFEAVVHDDASTDRSAGIIQEYAAKYPDIIKPIFECENQYSKRDGMLSKIMNGACSGKYIAMCEGDDYWTDPLKLQKQVDFMEAHPGCSMCFTRAVFHVEEDGEDHAFGDASDRYYSGQELFSRWTVPTASILYRKSVLDTPLYARVQDDKNFIYGDTPLVLTCASCGKVHGMSDVTCAYRKQTGGITAIDALSSEKLFELRKHYLEIPVVFGNEYLESAKRSAVNTCLKSIIVDFKNKRVNWEKIKTCLGISFFGTFKVGSVYLKERVAARRVRTKGKSRI